MFGKANVEEGMRVKHILSIYEESWGQMINYDKSAILFSFNVEPGCHAHLQNLLGVAEQSCIERYLGLPTMIGREKRKAFREIKERIEKKLQSWGSKFISQGG